MILQRIVTVLDWASRVLHGVLLTVFVGLMAMVAAVALGAGWQATLGAGVLGLVAGVAAAWRLWWRSPPPAAAPAPAPALEEWRHPGVQDEFDRLRARQGVLAALFIAAALMLIVLRVIPGQQWPAPFGVPRERLLVGLLAVLAVLIPLALLNWRCPRCRRNLGRGLVLRQCPHCGIVLRG